MNAQKTTSVNKSITMVSNISARLWRKMVDRPPIPLQLSVIVKLEIDFNNRALLEAKRAELKIALETVEFALSKFPQAPAQVGYSAEDMNFGNEPAVPVGAANGVGAEATIANLGQKFKSSEVYLVSSDSRSAIRETFRRLVNGGRLRVVESGNGRRPTIYEKTPKFYL